MHCHGPLSLRCQGANIYIESKIDKAQCKYMSNIQNAKHDGYQNMQLGDIATSCLLHNCPNSWCHNQKWRQKAVGATQDNII